MMQRPHGERRVQSSLDAVSVSNDHSVQVSSTMPDTQAAEEEHEDEESSALLQPRDLQDSSGYRQFPF